MMVVATKGRTLTVSPMVGYRPLGICVVEKLKEMGLPHIVIVRDESRLKDLRKSHILAFGSAMAKSFQTIKTVGASKASAIIASFDDDGDNLLHSGRTKACVPAEETCVG